MRWFVLMKMELQYFEHRVDLEPLKRLDLRKCRECAGVGTVEGHENCFRSVISPHFYILCRNFHGLWRVVVPAKQTGAIVVT